MKCTLRNRSNLIADYLNGELSDERKRSFQEHYFDCDICFEELRLAEDSIHLIKTDGPTVLAKREGWWSRKLKALSEKLHWEWHGKPRLAYEGGVVLYSGSVQIVKVSPVPLTATVMLLLASLVLSFLLLVDRPQFVAENFEKSPYFENLMTRTPRSEIFISDVQPKNDATLDGEIAFKWHIEENDVAYAGLLSLRIFNNKDEELFRFAIEENQYQLQEDLPPGLYYWTLLTEDETIHIGRFYMQKP